MPFSHGYLVIYIFVGIHGKVVVGQETQDALDDLMSNWSII
jgi:hypothetical protein